MIGLIAGGAAVFTGWLGVHPFTTYPLSLRLLARGRAPVSLGGVPPSRVAVCVCAYNEEGVIAARVENMLAQRRHVPGLEILVYVDAASDGTARVLQSYADTITLVLSAERLGKTAGMNTLVSMTDADIVVFSDANVIFADDALPHLLAPFADPDVGCVCGHLRYLEQDGATSTAVTGSLYWRLEEHIKALESATGSVMGADGSIFAVRRALHRAPPPHLIDDMFVSLSVLCDGARVVRADGAIAYERAVSRPAEEFRRKIRIACQAFNVNRALWPRLMRLPALDLYKYISHKLLRWLSIFLIALSAVLAWVFLLLLSGGTASLAALCVAVTLAAVVGVSRHAVPGKLREVVLALSATGIGVVRSCLGNTFQTWSPPASARAVPLTEVGTA